MKNVPTPTAKEVYQEIQKALRQYRIKEIFPELKFKIKLQLGASNSEADPSKPHLVGISWEVNEDYE